MALSGSFTNYFQGNASKFHMTTSWSATQNIANNTSTITAITTVRPEGAFSATASKNGSITIAGNRKNFTFVLGSMAAGATKEVGRHTVTFSHASNGTGSAAISSTLDINITYSGLSLGSLSTSGTASLNTIPRTSTFTIPSSFTVGSAFTVSISRASSSFTHEVAMLDGNTAFHWSGITSSTSVSSNIEANTLITRMVGVKSKTFTVSVTTYNGATWIGSQTKTITANIPVSTFTIPTSFTMGSAFTASISRVGSLTHWVELWDGSTRLYSSGNTIGTSDSVNVALSTLAARSPNAMSRTFTVKVSTYNGSTSIGSASQNITAYVPTSLKPTFSAVTASENVSSVASLVGAYVQTKSRLNLAITGASGIHGSTIRSYNITGVGHNVNSSSTVTGILSVSGNQTIKGTVTDSRGQTSDRSIVVNILPYTPPTLTGLSFKRTLPDKTEAPLGDNATVSATVKVHSLIVNGVQKNSIKYQVQSAQSGGSFADKANTTSTDLTKIYSDVWVGYSVDHYYNFRVRVGDVFGFGGWSVGVVPTGIVTQQWGSKTTSFGKMIDNTSYNVQVGTGGLHSEGPIVEGNERMVGASILPNSSNLNSIVKGGIYRLNQSVINGPPGADYGQLLVIRGSSDTIAQLVFPYGTDDIWRRSGNPSEVGGSGIWRPWIKVSMDGHTHAASAITSGAFSADRIPSLPASKITSGAFSADRIPSLPASKITSGTIADAILPAKSKPADFVVEIGSNTRGSWEKWDSGKLVQWMGANVNFPAGTAWGSVYYNDFSLGNWPIPFTSVTHAKENVKNNTYWSNIAGFTTTSSGSVRAFRPTSGSATGIYVSIEAIGSWK